MKVHKPDDTMSDHDFFLLTHKFWGDNQNEYHTFNDAEYALRQRGWEYNPNTGDWEFWERVA